MLLTKILARQNPVFNAFNIMALAQLIQFFIAVIWTRYTARVSVKHVMFTSINKEKGKFLAVRCILGWLANNAIQFGVTSVALIEVILIENLSPFVIAIFAILLLKE